MEQGKISRISGPAIVARDMAGVQMYELVKVGEDELIGEVIKIEGNNAVVQVYEQTTGVKPGQIVKRTGKPLSAELGPGIIAQIYDGIQRPLTVVRDQYGSFIKRGVVVDPLDKKKKWKFTPTAKKSDKVVGGDILGSVPESALLTQKILVPPKIEGILDGLVKEGEYTITEDIATVKTAGGDISLQLMHTWPVRIPRPYKNKLPSDTPLLTGQRIFDTFFPMVKGGQAAIPGGFGTGKTVMLQTLAQWADANVIVYIGCGERGNEMADVLERFPKLKDPKSGNPLVMRTVLIANTSNMPIAAREASVYTGITLAEYFRDMGYDIALMADSTSRWAEALREISGRLEEMPGEEGYPAYLASRLSEFYERAGRVETLGSTEKIGSVSVMGAVSPPGADFSEPVTQNTLRIIKAFWGLDKALAERRHFPAINWLTSYSLYSETLEDWFSKNIDTQWPELKKKALWLLQKEDELQEIVRLVGPDALSESQRAILEAARMIREDYLMQHALHPIDSYCPPIKGIKMLRTILKFYDKVVASVGKNISVKSIISMPFLESIARMKLAPMDKIDESFQKVDSEIDEQFNSLHSR